MADNDIRGHMAILARALLSDDWREIWLSLNLPIWSFADLSLTADAADAAVWHACQRGEVILITGNRNDDGDDSLQATIQAHNTPASLPVFTISEPKRVMRSPDYANRVVDRLLRYLMDIDNVRGAGRLWLP
jgi:hypothetical protein